MKWIRVNFVVRHFLWKVGRFLKTGIWPKPTRLKLPGTIVVDTAYTVGPGATCSVAQAPYRKLPETISVKVTTEPLENGVLSYDGDRLHMVIGGTKYPIGKH